MVKKRFVHFIDSILVTFLKMQKMYLAVFKMGCNELGRVTFFTQARG
jgi:hypothetical protein